MTDKQPNDHDDVHYRWKCPICGEMNDDWSDCGCQRDIDQGKD